jgi:hypothetical protein
MNPHRTIPRFAATILVIVAHLALGAVSVGCGGGNDNTSGSTSAVAIFTPDTPVAADGSITLLPGTTSGASVNVRVTVTQMPSFFGAAFRIKYDGTALLFNGMDSSTSFLRDGITDSNQLFFVSDSANSPGELVITATRLFPAVPVPLVSTTSDLVILNFVARKAIVPLAAEGRLEFVDPKQACNGTVAPPACGAITVTAWEGGGVSAQ